jgi:hypothetical protein
MTVVTTLDIAGLTATEYRAVMDELGVWVPRNRSRASVQRGL